MEQIIKKVLRKIESNGYEAYLVGGYVRDFILGKKTYDIDICTNALPKDLNKIFPSCINNNYGGITFKIKKFNFDITTYRKEVEYKDRKPIEIEYINNLFEDIMRRDFKINAICINSRGFIIDLIDGMTDIKNQVISTIGDCDKKFIEDPLRMLRAIRFATILDFNLDSVTYESIIRNRDSILSLSQYRIKEELDKILINKNAIKGLALLKELGILDLLKIQYSEIKYVSDPLGMWSQLKMDFNSAFTKEEKNTIINIRKILKTKRIDKLMLFDYGLYQCIVAGEILGINKITINKMYRHMAINNKQDLAISSQEIMNILNIEPSEILSVIINDIVKEILNRNLKNNYHEIKRFLLSKKAAWIR